MTYAVDWALITSQLSISKSIVSACVRCVCTESGLVVWCGRCRCVGVWGRASVRALCLHSDCAVVWCGRCRCVGVCWAFISASVRELCVYRECAVVWCGRCLCQCVGVRQRGVSMHVTACVCVCVGVYVYVNVFFFLWRKRIEHELTFLPTVCLFGNLQGSSIYFHFSLDTYRNFSSRVKRHEACRSIPARDG